MDQEATPLESGIQPCLRSSPKSETKQNPHVGPGLFHSSNPECQRSARVGEDREVGTYCVKGSKEVGKREMHEIYWGKIKNHAKRIWGKFLVSTATKSPGIRQMPPTLPRRARGLQWEAVQLTWNPAVSSAAAISWSPGLPFCEGVGLWEVEMAERGERSCVRPALSHSCSSQH